MVPKEVATCLVASCSPFADTIRIERSEGQIVVRWSCDTLGFHEHPCENEEEAQAVCKRLREEAEIGRGGDVDVEAAYKARVAEVKKAFKEFLGKYFPNDHRFQLKLAFDLQDSLRSCKLLGVVGSLAMGDLILEMSKEGL